MRHRMRGRKLGRNPSHRKAMFRNMACSLIRTVREPVRKAKNGKVIEPENLPKVAGRITTTLQKAKELRPYIERLITLAKKARPSLEAAKEFETSAARNSVEWKAWRESDQWNKWNQAIVTALNLRRRAFDILRDKQIVDVLFTDVADRFLEREGGYTRIIRIAKPRLGDSGEQALIEFVGVNDRVKKERRSSLAVSDEGEETSAAENSPVDESNETEETTSSEEATTEEKSE